MNALEPILVTGGTGFIGRAIIEKLLQQNLTVVSFSLAGEAAPSHWQDSVKIIYGDITKAADVNQAMKGIGTVIHLAAIVGGSTYEANWQVTVEGSRHLFEAALINKTKVVLASSVVVYGDQIRTELCHDGLQHGNHQGAYSRAKMAQEKLAIEYQNQHGMLLSIIRPGNVYGVGSGPWVEMIFNLLRAKANLIIDGGKGNAGLVHVENLADAFILAALHDKANGQIYTACDDLDVSWLGYFSDLAKIATLQLTAAQPLLKVLAAAEAEENLVALEQSTNPRILPLEFINLIGFSNRFDSSKLRQELGWQPNVDYDEAIEQIEANFS